MRIQSLNVKVVGGNMRLYKKFNHENDIVFFFFLDEMGDKA